MTSPSFDPGTGVPRSREAATRRSFLGIILLGAGAACSTAAPPVPGLPEMTFTHLGPIGLDVAALSIVDQSAQQRNISDQALDFTDRVPISPAEAVSRWSRARLQPRGFEGQVRVTIAQAWVALEPLPRQGGVEGLVTVEQGERLIAHLSAAVDAEAPSRGLTGRTEAMATRRLTLPENLTLNEREAEQYRLVESLMTDFDRAMVAALQRDLAPFIVA